MLFSLLATLVVALHLAFILFVLLGGLLVRRRPRVALAHLPCAAWGAFVEFSGRVCPLTPLELALRRRAGQAGYAEGFIEHYLAALVYPSGLTRELQVALGALVVLANAAAYAWAFARRRGASGAAGTGRAGREPLVDFRFIFAYGRPAWRSRMTNREFFVSRRKAEVPVFRQVLKAVPQGRLDYRPDLKARTAAELAWLLAVSESALAGLVATGAADWKDDPPPAQAAEIAARYERSAAEVDERLARLDDDAWERKVRLTVGGQAWEDTLGQMAWGFLFDAVHHRGQLTTYLRPMGGKVPPIYGPSADHPGQ
jgi:uncharacterized damage-inducible protein DinB